MKKEVAKLDIKNRIYTIRGQQVMFDRDLAALYGVGTRVLNQAVKRNPERFPSNYMFQLIAKELEDWKSQIVISNKEKMGLRKKPYVFTEQGVAMLAGILKSDTAIKISIHIINAFVAMRRFLAANAQVFQRIDMVEKKQIAYEIKTDERFRKVLKAIEDKSIKSSKGIFFNGQIFDAYKFVADLVRTAKKSIILIDNFVDDSVLTLFSKRKKGVQVTILTKNITKQLSLDLEKYNSQYPEIKVKEFKSSHDRFLIIDNKDVYHIGASLKDLGKKWFAFSKFRKEAFRLLERL